MKIIFQIEDNGALKVGINEKVEADFDGDLWMVSSSQHPDWNGSGETRIEATLAYLSSRLGYFIEPAKPDHPPAAEEGET